MTYKPQINDYVFWNDGKGVEGWVYFKDKRYITIEVSTRPKEQGCPFHQNYHILVLCYKNQWKELKYIKSRQSIFDSSSSTNNRTNYTTVESETSSD